MEAMDPMDDALRSLAGDNHVILSDENTVEEARNALAEGNIVFVKHEGVPVGLLTEDQLAEAEDEQQSLASYAASYQLTEFMQVLAALAGNPNQPSPVPCARCLGQTPPHSIGGWEQLDITTDPPTCLLHGVQIEWLPSDQPC